MFSVTQSLGPQVDDLKGGVAGGSILQGVLRVGDEVCDPSWVSLLKFVTWDKQIEVRPGIVSRDAKGAVQCVPIYSTIVSLFTEVSWSAMTS